ncbi:DUF4430 domain-containing protein [Marinilactibacillus psychrotolerans]|uniref:DUF4430 domain-containing protein n=2 Tax=Marinilactibacillus psychrotolerans TaxID=191770 RepID=A0A5R9C1B6_9LACT|nr:DUF4430 domain-containing protein [Marinilactibacillus psychrotolerans]TLQ06464.1 DUF4430 domain-containing protein [Marinilactibacillus psychrotolerans]GEQ32800.1 hypothetical protein B795N_06820 [Marinilactibacillus psychrotolerans]SJN40758.1 Additional lipoprotein component of predicted cobalamin ECF transporter [Marinilactibacillus psychrotolerans 42ea]
MKKIIGTSLFAILFAGCGNNEEKNGQEDLESGDSQGLITVEFKFNIDDDVDKVDEDKINKTVELSSGKSLLAAMKEQYEVIEDEGYITSIEGYEQSQEENIYWLYEINDEFAQVGAADYTLEDGDVISWELEPSE